MRTFFFLALLALFGPKLLAAPNEQKEIQQLYARGLAGDKGAVNQCIEKLERVLQTEAGNQLARVYLGSTYTLRSRDLGFGPQKLRALRHGLALMDEAVAAAPNESKIRLARALTTSALPTIFGRAGESRKDFLLLAQGAEAGRAGLDEGDLQVVYFQAGLAARTEGEKSRAIALWRGGLKHPNDAALTAKLNAELSKLQ